ncbi:DUF2163 domain-containing protein [Devosia sp. XJ19-1]|uniref:DUF2163 domain-containing protein n=1 Tax=Devosia ureilytica TaxID=2952754 RepID=A0A9Q4AP95_9HYPH|nr:DUF2163 domain-containing protein [Devosia ureilytica]MCP8884246.1 DUF2163 domain-containing protein [Devosia ureilytica]MCP8887854.1 DUF2163 domain-containing protein [Devosia ureilytica]
MRTLPPSLAAHLEQGETTTAHCWRVLRSDGVTLGFTDHDRAVPIEGTECVPTFGLDGGEVPVRLGQQVETGEVLGVLDSAAISEDDILLGRYDGAQVESWLVNWAAPEQRVLLRVDTIGEIVREDGVFRAELRSPQQALNVTRGRVYQGLCDAQVGDARCRVDLDLPAHRGTALVTAIIDAFHLRVSGLTGFEEDWFSFGVGLWSSGRRDGLHDAVLTHRREPEGDLLGFANRIGEWVEVGDSLEITVGCDRRFATCKSRFGNTASFRGFPHIPGSDYVLRHPRSGDAMDGRAVVP